jgi:hypothetical protein
MDTVHATTPRSASTAAQPRGWGVAAFIVALAVACAVGAYAIHVKTYCDPRHPECVIRAEGGGH